jgi:hypothetical protein
VALSDDERARTAIEVFLAPDCDWVDEGARPMARYGGRRAEAHARHVLVVDDCGLLLHDVLAQVRRSCWEARIIGMVDVSRCLWVSGNWARAVSNLVWEGWIVDNSVPTENAPPERPRRDTRPIRTLRGTVVG